MPSFDYTQVPIIISLIIILIGLTFRGMWLWISLTVAIVFLYIADKESIVTLVIYALTASLLIFGYINIKRGLNYSDPEKSDSTEFIFAVDANNLLGLVDWDLKKFSDFIDELEKDDMATHLFFDYGIKKTLKNGNLLNPKETVPIALCRILKRDRYNLTVSKKGHSADPLIIRYADRNNLTVLSNDKFDKSFDDKFFIMAAARLKQKGLIRRVGVVEGKLTIM